MLLLRVSSTVTHSRFSTATAYPIFTGIIAGRFVGAGVSVADDSSLIDAVFDLLLLPIFQISQTNESVGTVVF